MFIAESEHKPYGSLNALRKASDDLIESLPEDEEAAPDGCFQDICQSIRNLIERAVATGATLDQPDSRKAAQALIDFWVSRHNLMKRDRGASELIPRSQTKLIPFDNAVIETTVERGNSYIDSIRSDRRGGILSTLRPWLNRFGLLPGRTDYQIACRVLLRLVRLPEEVEGICVPLPTQKKALLAIADEARVAAVINPLVEAGILEISPSDGGELITLKYEALPRKWTWFAELIATRLYYRKRALEWVERGRRKRLLLEWRLIRKFRRYGNLDNLEQEYILASSAFAHRHIAATTIPAILVGVVTVAYGRYGVLFSELWHGIYSADGVKAVNQRISDPLTDPKMKAEKLKLLSAYNKKIEVVSGEFNGLNLAGISAPSAKFTTGIKIRNTDFSRSNLSGSRFDIGDMDNVNFTGAELKGAEIVGFAGAPVQDVTFRDADLRQATFERIHFCERVDFSGADLRETRFNNFRFQAVPNFDGAAWWLIKGLSHTDRNILQDKYPIIKDKPLPRLVADLKAMQSYVPTLGSEMTTGSSERFLYASMLNDEAWNLAIYGYDVDESLDPQRDGVKLARKSVQILDDLVKSESPTPSTETIKINRAYVADTLAYLLAQRATIENDEEKRKQLLEEAINLWEGALQTIHANEVAFRYALALNAVGRSDAIVTQHTALRDQLYIPTHELYLLKSFITGEFETRLTQLLHVPVLDTSQLDQCLKKTGPSKG